MSTPGSGGPQPPEQDPSQQGQPASWGQQPPVGQPYPGQQPPAGQPYPGQQPPAGAQPWGTPQQPGQPAFGQPAFGQPAFGQPAGAQAFGEPQKPKRRWLPIVGGIVALLVVFGALSTFLGGGEPKVGDCLEQDGATQYKTVDCDSDDAQFKVEGTDEDMTYNELGDAVNDDSACPDVDNWSVALWIGDDEDEDGHVYCASDV